ncbi:hypothetical protein K439DRAFT_1636033 [Ramaria rubella]|nr:hypothetical protein K439DRAFT_1636033 [Ramaria rubella]
MTIAVKAVAGDHVITTPVVSTVIAAIRRGGTRVGGGIARVRGRVGEGLYGGRITILVQTDARDML